MSLYSRPPSPLPEDRAAKFNELIQSLYSERETVASELEVLSSIYGENSIRIWRNDRTIRYEVDTK